MIKIYLIALAILGSLDALWLGIISKNFYKESIGFLFRVKAYMTPVIIWYLLYAIGLIVFVINPSLKSASPIKSSFMLGSFLGLIAYSTYNLVNYATINNWPLKVVLIDTLWGVLVSGITSVLAIYIINYLKMN